MSFISIQKFLVPKNKIILGVDEVGRGSLIGPVITCCLSINLDNNHKYIESFQNLKLIINDSKKISKKNRELLYEWTSSQDYIKFTIGTALPSEIDEINIRNATNLAMNRAIIKHINTYKLNSGELNIDNCYIDGNYFNPDYNLGYPKKFKYETVIKGDSKNIAIALASIIAKVYRDNLMKELSNKIPYYKLNKNMGYGTKEHFALIRKYGIHSQHRLSFLKNL